jgi:hypothetical protein
MLYDPIKKTCAKTITEISRGIIYYGNAAAARNDPKQCGPSGRFFESRPYLFVDLN